VKLGKHGNQNPVIFTQKNSEKDDQKEETEKKKRKK